MQKQNVLETMSAFTISEISFCYFIVVPNCFEHPMRQQSKSLYTHIHVSVVYVCGGLDIFFFLARSLYCNNKSNYEALFCLWNFTCAAFLCLSYSLSIAVYGFYISGRIFNSIHFHFILSLHLISCCCCCFFLLRFYIAFPLGSLR